MKTFAWSSPRWLLSVLLCLIVVPAYAADQWYAVELIVFAQKHPDAGNETWPENPGMPNMTGAQEVPTAAVKDSSLLPLPPEQFKLQNEEQKLAKDGNYEILLHTGWLQPGITGDKGIPVHIHTAPLAPTDSTATLTPAEPGAPQPSRLDGVVNLTLSRYLHLDVDLVLRGEPVAPADAGGFFSAAPTKPQIPLYRLDESRRMRSKEIHYFDHPMFGVIAVITPYDPPAAPAAVTAPGDAPALAPAAPVAPPAAAPAPQASADGVPGTSGMIRRD